MGNATIPIVIGSVIAAYLILRFICRRIQSLFRGTQAKKSIYTSTKRKVVTKTERVNFVKNIKQQFTNLEYELHPNRYKNENGKLVRLDTALELYMPNPESANDSLDCTIAQSSYSTLIKYLKNPQDYKLSKIGEPIKISSSSDNKLITEIRAYKCTNCGAPLKNQICEYCNTKNVVIAVKG